MLVVITGGTASGKSELSESLAAGINKKQLAYIATMIPHDEECRARIEKHKGMRSGKGFTTLEIPYDLNAHSDEITEYHTVLVECLSNLILNEMFIRKKNAEEVIESIPIEIRQLKNRVENLIIVSSILYSNYTPYDEFTQEYIRVLGRINSDLSQEADVVIEAVCSIPIIHKGKEEFLLYENVL